ncbi:amidohydrolase family protein [Streptomyces sp. NPDC005393]|uniref:amidohydrolase family protein n=1 Tax=Streptomyces sp. NPDC005393 TaxID=3157041 RepID=UPI0033A37EDD
MTGPHITDASGEAPHPRDALGIDLCIDLDIDTLLGRYPDRPGPAGDPAGDPEGIRETLRAHGIARAVVSSLRGALWDTAAGNADLLSTAARHPDLLPAGVVDFRDALCADRVIEQLARSGVRAVRLFPDEQHADPDFPAFRHIAKRAVAHGLVVLAGGDIRRVWRPLAGLDAQVVFLDTHFYALADFILVARDEPGFHTSTRLLNSPDALETVAAEVGPERLLFGSRTPLYEPVVPLLRLARSGLNDEARAMVAGGNARRLLAPACVRADGDAGPRTAGAEIADGGPEGKA